MSTVIATDTFTRADNSSTGMNLGANWTASVPGFDLGISSNQAYATATTNDNVAFWSANTFHVSQYGQVLLNVISDSYSGVVVRATATDQVVYQGTGGGTGQTIFWYNGGSYTQIGSTYVTADFSNGDTIKLEVDGDTFTGYQNGVSRVSGSNTSAPKTGSPGILIGSSTDRFDNFEGGDLYDFDVVSEFDSGAKSAVSSITVSVTVPSDLTNSLMVVKTQCRDGTDADRLVSSVVYNTIENLTKSKEQDNTTLDITSGIWHLIAPSTGTHNVVVTFTGTVDVAHAHVDILEGAKQTGQPDATNGASGATGTTATVNVTTVADNCLVFDSVYSKTANAMTIGASQAELAQVAVNAGGDKIAESVERKATAGSTTMSWTWTGTDDWITAGVSFAPFTASASTVKTLAALGVG